MNFERMVEVKGSTCEVTAGRRNIVVDFGSVPNSVFSGVGSRSVHRDFEIQLDCVGSSTAAHEGFVSIRLDAISDNSNIPGVLRLDAGSDSVAGIGIQMVRHDGNVENVVRFGEAIRIGATSASNRVMKLPLRARYIQTQAGKIGAGMAKGSATFTIQYD